MKSMEGDFCRNKIVMELSHGVQLPNNPMGGVQEVGVPPNLLLLRRHYKLNSTDPSLRGSCSRAVGQPVDSRRA